MRGRDSSGGAGGTTGGIDKIAAERQRQVAQEGWTSEHDDNHRDGSLAIAAACYAMPEIIYVERRYARYVGFVDPWPWANHEDKRKQQSNHVNSIPTAGERRIDMLVKAGALIAAEIDRLERKASL